MGITMGLHCVDLVSLWLRVYNVLWYILFKCMWLLPAWQGRLTFENHASGLMPTLQTLSTSLNTLVPRLLVGGKFMDHSS